MDRAPAGSVIAVGSSHPVDAAVPERGEYRALVEGYPDLLSAFGVVLTPLELSDLIVLMAAIEHVDRVLDAEPDAAERSRFAADVIAQLEGAPAVGPVRALRQLGVRRGIARELAALTADTLANTEQIRTARDRERYLALVEREGALCNELALLVVPLPATPAAFLRAIAPAANLMDKLIDLRGDHRRGEVIVDPGPRTHLALAGRMVAGAWTASRLHPSRVGFTRWGVRWLRRMAAS